MQDSRGGEGQRGFSLAPLAEMHMAFVAYLVNTLLPC